MLKLYTISQNLSRKNEKLIMGDAAAFLTLYGMVVTRVCGHPCLRTPLTKHYGLMTAEIEYSIL